MPENTLSTSIADIDDANRRGDRYKLRKLMVLCGLIAFLTILGVVSTLMYLPGAIVGRHMAYDLAVLIIVDGPVIVLVPYLATGFMSVRRGPKVLRLVPDGFQLVYENRTLCAKWTDPNLTFGLSDASHCPSDYVFVTPYALLFHGEEVNLTKEAFQSLLMVALQHGLVERVALASKWVYPTACRPMIHRITAPRQQGIVT